ncbi:MAG: TetR/AcrR family transcriptional regulator [Anaerolineae bacterium]|nr:TetR/AcrR family transcriptional regulator [Anaerolineae bacterium]
MATPRSKLDTARQNGAHQVDEQRGSILDAAEALFLQNGIDGTRMIDIAAQAGITKVTLYRYFPNRDVIALEIHARMMEKIVSSIQFEDDDFSSGPMKQLARSMIRNFDTLRDAYRYMGMFDALYLDQPSGSPLASWTKTELLNVISTDTLRLSKMRDLPQANRLIMTLSTVIWFLEKLALRGEVTWTDETVPLSEHLRLFEEMITGYLDGFTDTT